MAGKQSVEQLRPYQWKKGQSGNPAGRKPGTQTLKDFAAQYLKNLPPEEKVDFLAALPPEITWRMAEGNPHSTSDEKHEVILPKALADVISKDNSVSKDQSNAPAVADSSGGHVSIEDSIDSDLPDSNGAV